MRRVLLFAAAVALLAGTGASALPQRQAASSALPLRTALNDNGELDTQDAELFLRRLKASGATMLRVGIPWSAIATARPADATNPADPAYNWSPFDAKVLLLKQYGIEPIALIGATPAWATMGAPVMPDPKATGEFMRAAAQRYSGRTPGIPRIRYWQAWNEPNVNVYFGPQFKNGRPFSPQLYRQHLNQIAQAVRAVRPDNIVVTGGLSPFTVRRGATVTIGPLRFMRELLCMSKGTKPKPTCNARAAFDIWSHHPYTSGGPTHHAFHADDVSLGDLPEMQRLLRAAIKAGHVSSVKRVRFWVTEFSWDSSPPDPKAVPIGLHARWVSHALYVMWKNGIDLVAWLQMRDSPYPSLPVQSGLYFRGATMARDRAKPTLTAFRFPMVALRQRGRTLVWGRTPSSSPAAVVVERRTSGGWRRVVTLRANGSGIFTARLASPARGKLRARLSGTRTTSVPFSLAPVPDRFLRPFG